MTMLLVLGSIYFAGNNKTLPSGDEGTTPQPASAQATVEPPAPVNTETLEPSNVGETSLPEDSQPLELVTIKNKPLCVGGNQNCNFRHGETMECIRLFMAADYSAPTQHFCKKAAFYDNNPDIYYALARLYQNGVFGSEQRKLAAEWYEKAANLGHAASQNNLGVMYYYGDAVEKNTDLAIAWLEKASAQGLDEAKQSVEKLKARVSHTQQPAHTENQQADSTGTLGQVSGLNPQGDGFLAVRAEPNSSSPEVAKLHDGDKVRILQEENGWFQIALPNKNIRGWSYRKWIKLTPASESSEETASSNQRFISQNDTVKDTQTGLIWQRCSVGQIWDGKACLGKPKEFYFDDAQNQASNGWRLPTVRELVSLRVCDKGLNNSENIDLLDNGEKVATECAEGSSLTTIDPVFGKLPEWNYWTASEYRDDSKYAWSVGFGRGIVNYNYKHGYRSVRLARTSTDN